MVVFGTRTKWPVVDFDPVTCGLHLRFDVLCSLCHLFGHLLHDDRDDDDLDRGESGRENKSLVVAMNRDKSRNAPLRDPVAGLERKLLFAFLVLETDIECFCEIIAQMVDRSGLECPSVRHDNIGCKSEVRTGEFVPVRPLRHNDWHAELIVEIAVYYSRLFHLIVCILPRRMNGVGLLKGRYLAKADQWSCVLCLVPERIDYLV